MKFGKIKKPAFQRKDKRGVFSEMVNFGNWKNLITGEMEKGAEMGHHYHKFTIVFYYLLSGKAKIETLNLKTKQKKSTVLKPNQGYVFKPEEVRVITYQQKSQFIMMKSHVYNKNSPDLIDYPKDF